MHVGASSLKVLVQYEAGATLIHGGYVFFSQSEGDVRPIRSLLPMRAFEKNEGTGCSCLSKSSSPQHFAMVARNYQYDTLLGHTSVTVVSVKFSGNQHTLQNAVVMKWRKK